MKKFISVALLASFVSGNIFAKNTCADETKLYSSLDGLKEISLKATSVCYGTKFHDVEEKLKQNLRIAKNRLVTSKDMLDENKYLYAGALALATARSAAVGSAAVIGTIAGLAFYPVTAVTVGAFSLLASSGGPILAAGAGIGTVGTMGIMMISPKIKQMGSDEKFKSYDRVSPELLTSTIDRDINAFEVAHDKILDTQLEYSNKLQEGGNLSWNDVEYLKIQIEARRAQNRVYKDEIEYYNQISWTLAKMCHHL